MAHESTFEAAAFAGASANPLSGMASRIDRVLGAAVEAVAALLVLAEICVLFAGVVSRYLFHAPLVWSDELASILFLWLSMLGAVVALRRGEHMRMTALLQKVRPPTRAMLDAFAIAASVAFLVLIVWPSIDYAHEESFIVTPALEVSNAWRAAAIPAGIGIMLVMALLRLLRVCTGRQIAFALVGTAALAGAFWLAAPVFATLGKLNLVIFFVVIVAATVLSGVPIAFSFALATFGYLALTTRTPLLVMVGRLDEGMSHLILLAVPLFIFLGALIEMTGMARAMIQFLASLLGHVRGGLSYVLIGAMYLVSGISGSKIADMAAIAPVLFPEMTKRGAKPGDLVALLSATGAQTETIPPSIVLITIGSVTGVSIAALFTGGLLPAVVLGAALCAVVWWRYRREDLSGVQRYSKREIGKLLLVALPAVLLPFVIRAAVVEGVATATEVSASSTRPSWAWWCTASSTGGGSSRCSSTRPRSRARSSSSSAAPRPWPGASRSRGFRRTWRGSWARCPAGPMASWPCRSSPSSCWAACSRGFRPSCCSGRCCFPSPRPPACTRCTTPWSSSSPWASACSRPPSAWATTARAPSARSTPTRASGTSGATSARCWSAW